MTKQAKKQKPTVGYRRLRQDVENFLQTPEFASKSQEEKEEFLNKANEALGILHEQEASNIHESMRGESEYIRGVNPYGEALAENAKWYDVPVNAVANQANAVGRGIADIYAAVPKAIGFATRALTGDTYGKSIQQHGNNVSQWASENMPSAYAGSDNSIVKATEGIQEMIPSLYAYSGLKALGGTKAVAGGMFAHSAPNISDAIENSTGKFSPLKATAITGGTTLLNLALFGVIMNGGSTPQQAALKVADAIARNNTKALIKQYGQQALVEGLKSGAAFAATNTANQFLLNMGLSERDKVSVQEMVRNATQAGGEGALLGMIQGAMGVYDTKVKLMEGNAASSLLGQDIIERFKKLPEFKSFIKDNYDKADLENILKGLRKLREQKDLTEEQKTRIDKAFYDTFNAIDKAEQTEQGEQAEQAKQAKQAWDNIRPQDGEKAIPSETSVSEEPVQPVEVTPIKPINNNAPQSVVDDYSRIRDYGNNLSQQAAELEVINKPIIEANAKEANIKSALSNAVNNLILQNQQQEQVRQQEEAKLQQRQAEQADYWNKRYDTANLNRINNTADFLEREYWNNYARNVKPTIEANVGNTIGRNQPLSVSAIKNKPETLSNSYDLLANGAVTPTQIAQTPHSFNDRPLIINPMEGSAGTKTSSVTSSQNKQADKAKREQEHQTALEKQSVNASALLDNALKATDRETAYQALSEFDKYPAKVRNSAFDIIINNNEDYSDAPQTVVDAIEARIRGLQNNQKQTSNAYNKAIKRATKTAPTISKGVPEIPSSLSMAERDVTAPASVQINNKNSFTDRSGNMAVLTRNDERRNDKSIKGVPQAVMGTYQKTDYSKVDTKSLVEVLKMNYPDNPDIQAEIEQRRNHLRNLDLHSLSLDELEALRKDNAHFVLNELKERNNFLKNLEAEINVKKEQQTATTTPKAKAEMQPKQELSPIDIKLKKLSNILKAQQGDNERYIWTKAKMEKACKQAGFNSIEEARLLNVTGDNPFVTILQTSKKEYAAVFNDKSTAQMEKEAREAKYPILKGLDTYEQLENAIRNTKNRSEQDILVGEKQRRYTEAKEAGGNKWQKFLADQKDYDGKYGTIENPKTTNLKNLKAEISVSTTTTPVAVTTEKPIAPVKPKKQSMFFDTKAFAEQQAKARGYTNYKIVKDEDSGLWEIQLSKEEVKINNEKKYRYYLTQRPATPGAFPNARENSAVNIVNFDNPQEIEGLYKPVYGYVEYSNPLSKQDVSMYELTVNEKIQTAPTNINEYTYQELKRELNNEPTGLYRGLTSAKNENRLKQLVGLLIKGDENKLEEWRKRYNKSNDGIDTLYVRQIKEIQQFFNKIKSTEEYQKISEVKPSPKTQTTIKQDKLKRENAVTERKRATNKESIEVLKNRYGDKFITDNKTKTGIPITPNEASLGFVQADDYDGKRIKVNEDKYAVGIIERKLFLENFENLSKTVKGLEKYKKIKENLVYRYETKDGKELFFTVENNGNVYELRERKTFAFLEKDKLPEPLKDIYNKAKEDDFYIEFIGYSKENTKPFSSALKAIEPKSVSIKTPNEKSLPRIDKTELGEWQKLTGGFSNGKVAIFTDKLPDTNITQKAEGDLNKIKYNENSEIHEANIALPFLNKELYKTELNTQGTQGSLFISDGKEAAIITKTPKGINGIEKITDGEVNLTSGNVFTIDASQLAQAQRLTNDKLSLVGFVKPDYPVIFKTSDGKEVYVMPTMTGARINGGSYDDIGSDFKRHQEGMKKATTFGFKSKRGGFIDTSLLEDLVNLGIKWAKKLGGVAKKIAGDFKKVIGEAYNWLSSKGTAFKEFARHMHQKYGQPISKFIKGMYNDVKEVLTAEIEFGSKSPMTHNRRRGSIALNYKPKKTEKVYKLMKLGKDGKLYPLFIDSGVGIEVGKWYKADSPDFSFLKKLPAGIHLCNLETGEVISSSYELTPKGEFKKPSKAKVEEATKQNYRYMLIKDKSGEKSATKFAKKFGDTRAYYNIGINGAGSSGTVAEFALRPGWHAGSLPSMQQIGLGKDKNIRDDRYVWTESIIPADIDYQEEANANPEKDIPTHIPEDGYYIRATNPTANDEVKWYIAGALKVNRILSDDEADNVINKHNQNYSTNIPLDHRRANGRKFYTDTMRIENDRNNPNATEPVAEQPQPIKKKSSMRMRGNRGGYIDVSAIDSFVETWSKKIGGVAKKAIKAFKSAKGNISEWVKKMGNSLDKISKDDLAGIINDMDTMNKSTIKGSKESVLNRVNKATGVKVSAEHLQGLAEVNKTIKYGAIWQRRGYAQGLKDGKEAIKQKFKDIQEHRDALTEYATAVLPPQNRGGILASIIKAKFTSDFERIDRRIEEEADRFMRTNELNIFRKLMKETANMHTIHMADREALLSGLSKEEIDNLMNSYQFVNIGKRGLRKFKENISKTLKAMGVDGVDIPEIVEEAVKDYEEQNEDIITLKELKAINDCLIYLKEAQRNTVRAIQKKALEEVKADNKAIISELPKSNYDLNSRETNDLGIWKTYIAPNSVNSLDGYNFAHSLGKTGGKVFYENLYQGQKKTNDMLMQGYEAMDNIAQTFIGGNGAIKNWQDNAGEKLSKTAFKVKTDKGHIYEITEGEKLTIAALAMDNKIGVDTLAKSGMVIGKENSDTFHLTEQTIDKIINSLKPEELTLIKNIKDYFKNATLPELNKVYQNIHGAPLVQNADGSYFPSQRRIDARTYNPEIKDDFMQQLMEAIDQTPGFTKFRVDTTAVPYVVRDIFQVMKRHVEDTSLYIGLTEPVRHALRVLKSPQMKNEIINSLGTQTYARLMDRLRAMIGQSKRNVEEGFFNVLQRRVTPYLLTATSAVKQYSSVMLASSVIEPKYIRQAMLEPTSKATVERMLKNSFAYLRYRDNGVSFLIPGLSNYEQQNEYAKAFTGLLGEVVRLNTKMDKFSLAKIYSAAEKQVAEKGGNIDDLFTKAVMLTQNTTDPLNNTGWQHKATISQVWASLNIFQAQTQKMSNVIQRCLKEGKTGIAITAVLFSALWNSLMEYGRDKALGRRDKKDSDEPSVYWKKKIANEMSNVIGNPLTRPLAKYGTMLTQNTISGKSNANADLDDSALIGMAEAQRIVASIMKYVHNNMFEYKKNPKKLKQEDPLAHKVYQAVMSPTATSISLLAKFPPWLYRWAFEALKNHGIVNFEKNNSKTKKLKSLRKK